MNDIIRNRNVDYIDKVVEKLVSNTVMERWGHDDSRIVKLPYFQMTEGHCTYINTLSTQTNYWTDIIIMFNLNPHESNQIFIKWKDSLRKMM